MEKNLAEQFIESEGAPLQVGDKTVHLAFQWDDLAAGQIVLSMTPRGELPQGVGISAEGGWLTINQVKNKHFAVWCASAPDPVTIDAAPLRGRSTMTVRIWNIWEHTKWGSMMAGVGNTGILSDRESPDAVLLRASAGPGSPSFDDLTVRLRFVPAPAGSRDPEKASSIDPSVLAAADPGVPPTKPRPS